MKYNPKISDLVRGEQTKRQDFVTNKPPTYESPEDTVIRWENIKKKDGFYIHVNLFGTDAATAGNYTHFFTARYPLEVTHVSEVHATAGSDAGAVTLDIERLTGTTAPGSGDSILSSTFDLKGTANTVVEQSGSDMTSYSTLKQGHRLALVLTGTPTAVDSVCVTLYCRFANRGDYK